VSLQRRSVGFPLGIRRRWLCRGSVRLRLRAMSCPREQVAHRHGVPAPTACRRDTARIQRCRYVPQRLRAGALYLPHDGHHVRRVLIRPCGDRCYSGLRLTFGPPSFTPPRGIPNEPDTYSEDRGEPEDEEQASGVLVAKPARWAPQNES
jgi:hypothetical protein